MHAHSPSLLEPRFGSEPVELEPFLAGDSCHAAKSNETMGDFLTLLLGSTEIGPAFRVVLLEVKQSKMGNLNDRWDGAMSPSLDFPSFLCLASNSCCEAGSITCSIRP